MQCYARTMQVELEENNINCNLVSLLQINYLCKFSLLLFNMVFDIWLLYQRLINFFLLLMKFQILLINK